MTLDLTSAANHEERLNEVLLAYVEALQDGRPLDRQQLLAAHPDLRQDLEAFFSSHDEVERLAAPLREASKEGAGAPVSGQVPAADEGDSPGTPSPEIGQL